MSIFNDLICSLNSDYSQLCNSKAEAAIKDCFEAKFKTSWETQISEVSCYFKDLIDFLSVAIIIKKLVDIMTIIKKYHVVNTIQDLFRYLDNSFDILGSDKYIEVKNDVKMLKQELRQYGISNEWINSHFDTATSKEENSIPTRNKNEYYSHYLKRVLRLSFGNFEEMMKLYKKVTPEKDWLLYDNIKTLVTALWANGIDRTANQLYDYLRKE